MKKHSIAFGVVTAILLSVPLNSYAESYRIAATDNNYQIENINDIKPSHWAYNAVKLVLEDLGIMEPKEYNRFLGDKVSTRYELAKAFYLAAKKLEQRSGKDLRLVESLDSANITDVDQANQSIINSVVNEYGIMQLLPDNKFMGNRGMTRYELAFDLNNYLMLLEKKVGMKDITGRERLEELTDVSESHWAYYALKNIVDKYKIMDGYPQKVFGGEQRLTRYEVASVLRRFVEFINENIISFSGPAATPTPVPSATPIPTPVPTPLATPSPVQSYSPEPVKAPSTNFDLKVGGSLLSLFTPSASETSFLRFGPSLDLDATYWFEQFGVNLNGGNLFFDQNSPVSGGSNRLSLGGALYWRPIGYLSDQDISFALGLGYNYNQWVSSSGSFVGQGPKAEVLFEAPIIPWLSFVAKDSFSYYIPGNTQAQMTLRNDIFLGFNLPAYSLFSVQLGLINSSYVLNSKFTGQSGLQGNLRFRF